MRTKHPHHPPEITLARAHPKLKRRASGWWDWWLQNGVTHEVVPGIGGMERSKEKASKLASAASEIHNKAIRVEIRHRADKQDIVPRCVRKPRIGSQM